MDPQHEPSKNQSRPHDNSTSSTFGSGGGALSSLGSTATTSTGGAHSTTTATTTTAPTIPSTTTSSSSSSSTLLGSIVASARNAAATLDPRQADVLRQHHSFGGGGGSSSSSQAGGIGSSSSKGTTSSASRSFQHTTNALETLGSSSSSTTTVGSGTGYSSGFRQTTAPTSSASTGGGMDWDTFLGSSESTVQDSAPYKPPSMASFGFSTLPDPEPVSETRHDLLPQLPYQQSQQGRHQFAEAPSPFSQAADAYQSHLSQPMNLTPANHAAFLEYLKSTAYPTQQSPTSASASTTTATTTSSSAPLLSSATPVLATTTTTTRPAPPQLQHQSYQPYQPYQPYQLSASTTARPLFSNDIQHQQQHDGGDILDFLNSTSYSEYVDELDSAGARIEKHQQERREFVYTYTEADLGRRSLFSTLQLIQHLPSERQDIVQYLLQQGSYADDVWGRPFSQDVRAEEGVSLDATLAEQDKYLKEQLQKREGGERDEMEEEMERVLKEIVENAKEEVTSTGGGQTDGKALNRLLMVRSHIIMGTKL